MMKWLDDENGVDHGSGDDDGSDRNDKFVG